MQRLLSSLDKALPHTVVTALASCSTRVWNSLSRAIALFRVAVGAEKLSGSTRVAVLLSLGLLATAVLLALALDTDNDTMTDDYELFFGLNPTNAADASLNYDSDILTNLQEYSLWSDPFSTDTDCDGFPDGLDSDALSRAFIGWGDPLFTYTNEYRYTGPDWWLGAYKVGGQWTTNEPYAWHVAGGTSTASLRIDLDRATLTNNLRVGISFYDFAGSALYVDLLDTNDSAVATNLFGNLLSGGNTTNYEVLNIPLQTYDNAAVIDFYRGGTGQVTVYENLLYVDLDGDGLDADQEDQLGTSDQDTDSDDDGLGDYAEVFTYGSDPAVADHTRYVSPNGGNVSPYVSWATAATNIQAAINVCAAGDLVVVSNGVYQTGGLAVGGGATNRVALTRAITVRSVNGPAVTVIKGAKVNGGNGAGAVRCAYLTNGASLVGFTLTNGATKSSWNMWQWRDNQGGGVACEGTGAVVSNCLIIDNISSFSSGGAYGGTLRNCTLQGNSTWWRGGGAGGSELYGCLVTNNYAGNGGGVYGSTLHNCTVAGNAADTGGGIMDSSAYDSTLSGNEAQYDTGGGGAAGYGTLSNCLIVANDAQCGGGGGSQGTAVLYDCTLIGNSAGLDGGGATYGGTLYRCVIVSNTAAGYSGGGTLYATLYNCVLVGNSASYGGGASGGKLQNCTVTGNSAEDGGGTDGGTLTNCIVYGNTAPSNPEHNGGTFGYSCTTPSPGGMGNTTNAPFFVDADNPAGADGIWRTADDGLRLASASPCRDSGTTAGAPATDILGTARPQGSGIDMGAYETPIADISGTVSYTGPQSGTIRVVAVNVSDSWAVTYSDTIAATGAYELLDLPTQTNWWIKAYRDSDADGSNDAWEAYGVYPSNPIMLTTNRTGVNVTMADPDADSDGLPDWWELLYFGNLGQTASGDPDNDGYSNLEECRFRIDPTTQNKTGNSAWYLLPQLAEEPWTTNDPSVVTSATIDVAWCIGWDRFYLSRSDSVAMGWTSTGLVFNANGVEYVIPVTDSVDITASFTNITTNLIVQLEHKTGCGNVGINGPVYLHRWHAGANFSPPAGEDGDWIACVGSAGGTAGPSRLYSTTLLGTPPHNGSFTNILCLVSDAASFYCPSNAASVTQVVFTATAITTNLLVGGNTPSSVVKGSYIAGEATGGSNIVYSNITVFAIENFVITNGEAMPTVPYGAYLLPTNVTKGTFTLWSYDHLWSNGVEVASDDAHGGTNVFDITYEGQLGPNYIANWSIAGVTSSVTMQQTVEPPWWRIVYTSNFILVNSSAMEMIYWFERANHTPYRVTNVTWGISPQVTGGATLQQDYPEAGKAMFSPGSMAQVYYVTARDDFYGVERTGTVVVAKVDLGQFDHVCRGAQDHAAHVLPVTILPSGTNVPVSLTIVTPARAIFQETTSSNQTISASSDVTIVGAAASPIEGYERLEAWLGDTLCTSRQFTVFDMADLWANGISDLNETNEMPVLYVAQGTDNTAQVELDFTWQPADAWASNILWQIQPTDCWDIVSGDGRTNLLTLTWDAGDTTGRVYTVRAWVDCNTNGEYEMGECVREVGINVLKVEFDVTEWNPTVRDATNHFVDIYPAPPDHYSTSVPRVPAGDTFELDAKVKVFTDPACSCPEGDGYCAEWNARIFQNVVAHSNHTVRWTTNYVAYSVSPIPGYDPVEDEKAFTNSGDEVTLSVADTPSDSYRPLWWPLSGQPNNPLTQITRDTTFVTWLVTQHETSGQIQYLKWVKWRVAYDVGYAVASSNVTTTLNAWTFQVVDQGDGKGPHTPTFAGFSETVTGYPIP